MTSWYTDYYREQYADSVRGIATPEQAATEVGFILQETGLRAPAAVADVACGSGRHARAFATRGFRVTGVDQNAAFIAQARAAAPPGVEFLVHDMRAPVGGPYALVTILFHSFGFFDDAANRQVIAGWSSRLAPGGWFVLDVWNRDMIMRHFAARRTWTASATLQVDEQRTFDPLAGRLGVHYTYSYADGSRYEHDGQFRLYTASELRTLCEGAGLTVQQVFGSLAGDPYDLDARHLVMLARKPQDAPAKGPSA